MIEMNRGCRAPRPLASKATGFPIAKVAAQLAVGFTLDEIRNEVTGRDRRRLRARPWTTWSSRLPRFNFEEVPRARPRA